MDEENDEDLARQEGADMYDAFAEEEGERWLAQWDDDPSPYDGTYSEE
jgi:hypothetical protein